MNDEMAAAHSKDYERLARYRRLAQELKDIAEERQGFRLSSLCWDLADDLEKECARIVLAWN